MKKEYDGKNEANEANRANKREKTGKWKPVSFALLFIIGILVFVSFKMMSDKDIKLEDTQSKLAEEEAKLVNNQVLLEELELKVAELDQQIDAGESVGTEDEDALLNTKIEYEAEIDELEQYIRENEYIIEQYTNHELVQKNEEIDYRLITSEGLYETKDEIVSEINTLVYASKYSTTIKVSEQLMDITYSASYLEGDILYLAMLEYDTNNMVIGYINISDPEAKGLVILYSGFVENREDSEFIKDGDTLIYMMGSQSLVFDLKNKEYLYSEVYQKGKGITYTTNRDQMFVSEDYKTTVNYDDKSYDLFTGFFAGEDGFRGLGYAFESGFGFEVDPSGQYISYYIAEYEWIDGPIITDLLGQQIFHWPYMYNTYGMDSKWIGDQQLIGIVYGEENYAALVLDLDKKQQILLPGDEPEAIYSNEQGLFIVSDTDYDTRKTTYKLYETKNLNQYAVLEIKSDNYADERYFDKEGMYMVDVSDSKLIIDHYTYDLTDFEVAKTLVREAAINPEISFIYGDFDGFIYGKAKDKVIDLYRVNENGTEMEYLGMHDFKNEEADNFSYGLFSWDVFDQERIEHSLGTDGLSYKVVEDKLYITGGNNQTEYVMDLNQCELLQSSYFYGLLRLHILEWIDEDTFEIKVINQFAEDISSTSKTN